MFSIPSSDLETPQDLAEELQRLSSSTISSLSSSADEESFDLSKKEDAGSKIEWETVEENVMNWFTCKKIGSGNPEELIQHQREKQKKLISLKSLKIEGIGN